MKLVKHVYDKCRNVRSKLVLLCYKIVYNSSFIYKKGAYVRKGFSIVVEKNGRIMIGENVFFNNYCSINCLDEIEIGDNCIFGENVHIYDHNHVYSDSSVPINSQGFTMKRVIIGDNCWIGSNVTILKGVSIGPHCVIGAGCNIFKDIEPNSIVVNHQTMSIQSLE